MACGPVDRQTHRVQVEELVFGVEKDDASAQLVRAELLHARHVLILVHERPLAQVEQHDAPNL